LIKRKTKNNATKKEERKRKGEEGEWMGNFTEARAMGDSVQNRKTAKQQNRSVNSLRRAATD
jgi:hypothetical protein